MIISSTLEITLVIISLATNSVFYLQLESLLKPCGVSNYSDATSSSY